jgi:hypothetical protein
MMGVLINYGWEQKVLLDGIRGFFCCGASGY